MEGTTSGDMSDLSDDMLSQALTAAEIKFENYEEISNLTQRRYTVETEPVTDDSEDSLDHLLQIVKENDDVTCTQLCAIENAVDVTEMGDISGRCAVGAQQIKQKPGTLLRAIENAVDVTKMGDISGPCAVAVQIKQKPELKQRPVVKSVELADPEATATGPKRFNPVSTNLIEELGKPFVPPNTARKNKWSVNVFSKWRREFTADSSNTSSIKGECAKVYAILSDENRELHHLTDSELAIVLCVFVLALKKENGEDYPGESLLSIVCGIQRHLRLHDRQIDFFNDPAFLRLKTTLDNTMQNSRDNHVGIHRKQAQVITFDHEEMLWAKALLGSSTPQALVDTLFWTIGINFGLRGGDEHRNLTLENFQIKSDSDGRRYLQYTESISKTYRGELKHRNIAPHTARAYELKNSDRCPVKLFECYLKHLAKDRKPNYFYYHPLAKPTGNTWFSKQGIGHNKLDIVVQRLMQCAGIEGYFTNHSLRVSTATRLYNAGLDEQVIKEQTGHRSAAVEAYKRTSDSMKRTVSSILQGAETEKNPKRVQVECKPATEENSSAFTFNNCSVTINKY